MAHLWTKAPPPLEYVEYRVCHEFKWTLAQLRRQPAEDIFQLLECMDAEAQVSAVRARHTKRK